MEHYMDIDGDSGVSGYEIGVDFIRVQFSTGSIYLYTYDSAGQDKIDRIKVLARMGDGLNSFINTSARKLYARKEC
jgi:hypothetical protein